MDAAVSRHDARFGPPRRVLTSPASGSLESGLRWRPVPPGARRAFPPAPATGGPPPRRGYGGRYAATRGVGVADVESVRGVLERGGARRSRSRAGVASNHTSLEGRVLPRGERRELPGGASRWWPSPASRTSKKRCGPSAPVPRSPSRGGRRVPGKGAALRAPCACDRGRRRRGGGLSAPEEAPLLRVPAHDRATCVRAPTRSGRCFRVRNAAADGRPSSSSRSGTSSTCTRRSSRPRTRKGRGSSSACRRSTRRHPPRDPDAGAVDWSPRTSSRRRIVPHRVGAARSRDRRAAR